MRRLAVVLAAMLVFAAPAVAQSPLLMPGVTYTREVEFTPVGPVVVHVITAPRPGGLYALKPVLSQDAVVGRERVTDMEKDVSPSATVAGVNGDLFELASGRPSGVLMRSGVLDTPPLASRSSIGIGGDGSLHVDRISFNGYWKGSGQRRPLTLNQDGGTAGTTLYTPSWGPATPPESGAVLEEVLAPFAGSAPNTDLTGTVTQAFSTGGVTIPPGGAVLVARGGQAQFLGSEAPVGSAVTVRLTLTPSWAGIVDAIGGGPVIVRRGRPVFRGNEDFSTDQLARRDPRTAVGQLADGRIVLVGVDGRQPGYSVGMTNFELALMLVRLGAVTASALDSGGSTTVAFDGQLLNRPSDPGGERPISEALLEEYFGVYAPPPAVAVLSPNSDGVDDTQSLSFKLVRPATVSAVLVGPDGVTRPLDSGPKTEGIYRYAFSGFTADGKPEPEGKWRFSVTGDDAQGQHSAAERTFSLNDTLGFLKAPAAVTVQKSGIALRATYVLAHPAQVTVTVRTAAGALVRTLARAQLQPGTQSVAWDGRTDARLLAYRGSYALVVSATNQIGAATVTQLFTVDRG